MIAFSTPVNHYYINGQQIAKKKTVTNKVDQNAQIIVHELKLFTLLS